MLRKCQQLLLTLVSLFILIKAEDKWVWSKNDGSNSNNNAVNNDNGRLDNNYDILESRQDDEDLRGDFQQRYSSLSYPINQNRIYPNREPNYQNGILVGPEGPTGFIGRPGALRGHPANGILVGPQGPTGIIGRPPRLLPYASQYPFERHYYQQGNPANGVLVGPEGPTGFIGRPGALRGRPANGILVGPEGPTGIIGRPPQHFQHQPGLEYPGYHPYSGSYTKAPNANLCYPYLNHIPSNLYPTTYPYSDHIFHNTYSHPVTNPKYGLYSYPFGQNLQYSRYGKFVTPYNNIEQRSNSILKGHPILSEEINHVKSDKISQKNS